MRFLLYVMSSLKREAKVESNITDALRYSYGLVDYFVVVFICFFHLDFKYFVEHAVLEN